MKVAALSGGVGGAKMARGLAAVPGIDLTVVVNVGDDAENHGLRVSPDLDTVVYTMAGVEGPHGWGRAGDTFNLNDELGRFGVDNTFQLGDRDLALKLFRTHRMSDGEPLSAVTRHVTKGLGIEQTVLPASDQAVRTEVRISESTWLGFQEYFVHRRHRDEVLEVRFAGAHTALPAPGVVEAIGEADTLIIAPSNPPLSIWPILAVECVHEAVAEHPKVVAVSPLFGGKALKGPADRVMASLGLSPGNRGVAEAYAGLIETLVVDLEDENDAETIDDVDVVVADTRIGDTAAGRRLAEAILGS
jgi:LPPG:FO 2-phospho-L-lactate transferase